MMKLIQEKDKIRLCLEGELTINNASVFKEDLLKSLQKNDCIELDLDAVTAVDLTCLQLICSAHHTASIKGKVLTLKKPQPPLLYQARQDAGFVFQQPCHLFPQEDCPWVGGTNK